MASIPRGVLAVFAVGAALVALVQALSLVALRWRRRRRASIRMDRALRGEQRAARWLADLGYAILGAQVAVEHAVHVDDRVVRVALRADYLVERGGLRYVVEVKTGALAPRIETGATRRQMLEYRLAFEVDGVLLVDGESGRVHEVTFPSLDRLTRSRSPWGIVALVIAAIAGVVVAVHGGGVW